MSIPISLIDLSFKTSDIDTSCNAVLSKSIPSNRPIASLATTTVFNDDNTRRGTGKYCSAVRDANVVVGDGECIESESELRIEEAGDLDRGLSPIAKYPSSTSMPSGCAMLDANVAVCGLPMR
jgi:hypothetical protein